MTIAKNPMFKILDRFVFKQDVTNNWWHCVDRLGNPGSYYIMHSGRMNAHHNPF